MSLQGVRQENITGCFVAAVATLLGKSYRETFWLLHPHKHPDAEYQHGFFGVSMEQVAIRTLKRVGIHAHRSNLKSFNAFRKCQQHALLIIRWISAPELCHTIVFDGDDKKFIDPTYGRAIATDYECRRLVKCFEFGLIIDQLPKDKTHAI